LTEDVGLLAFRVKRLPGNKISRVVERGIFLKKTWIGHGNMKVSSLSKATLNLFMLNE